LASIRQACQRICGRERTEDQRARPAEIVIPSVNEGSHKPLPGTERPAKRERSARTSGEKSTRAFFKASDSKAARPLEVATYCFAEKFRAHKNTDLTVSEIVSFVAALGPCLSGAEAVVAFSIAT
jgi:hypothetical protein